jgi:NAD(P)-dependent dehydrogenase (short-subunit alcohol dehydrogenase family)
MIIVTGSARGIGKHLFEHFPVEGVLGIYNQTSPADPRRKSYKLDIGCELEVDQFFEKYGSQLSNVVLINCAGISYNSAAHKVNLTSWKKVVDVNLVATFNLIRNVLPIMRKDNFGRIINFSSVAAQRGVAGTSAYAASKSALWGLAKAVALENGSRNITINNINLGYCEAGMIEQVPDLLKEDILKQIPSHRLCPMADVINTVEYIISTPYLNGTSIDLNGGLF